MPVCGGTDQLKDEATLLRDARRTDEPKPICVRLGSFEAAPTSTSVQHSILADLRVSNFARWFDRVEITA